MHRLQRRAAALMGALLLIGAATIAGASAAAAESIQQLQVAVTVNADTSIRVVETITYDFESEYRHGIFRDIPVYDETLTGQRRSYGVTTNGVTMDGAPVPWTTSQDGAFLNVRIGDPNQTITGPHTYVVDYTVTDALRVITADDAADPLMPPAVSAGDVELYWDFIGTGWDVWIASAKATVTGPGDPLSAICYSGSAGSDARCPSAIVTSLALMGPVALDAGQAMTGAVVYPAAAFTSVPRENTSQGLPSSPVVGLLGGLIPAALLVVVPIALATARRRADAGAPVPGAPPQYSPPDGLTPAELTAAWQGRKGTVDSRVLVATLLDLAARRWVNVSTDPGGDLTVTWVGGGSPPRAPWEEALVGAILKGQTSATLSGYDKQLATEWGDSFRELVQAQEANGRRNPRGDRPDQRWRGLGAVGALLILAGFLSLFIQQPFITAMAFTAGIGALIGFFVARAITPRQQTPQSARFLAEVDGFRVVLGTDAAASRREFAQRSGLSADAIFATMLPFAVVFELESSWIGAFPDLSPDQLVSHGFYVGSVASMDSLVSSGTSSMSSAMTAPSSGSGGGGFSGGGGGGGGGGSW
jgi:uncharacterized membrane protein YgcG